MSGGKPYTKRPEMKRLLDDVKAGKIDIILTKSISRFARNTVDLLNVVRHLKELGVEVRFEKENIYSLTGDGELMLSILASFAQEETISISNNVKWGIRKKFEKGIPNGSPKVFKYEDFENGVVVVNVVKSSPAEQAGLKKGDVILEISDDLLSGPGLFLSSTENGAILYLTLITPVLGFNKRLI